MTNLYFTQPPRTFVSIPHQWIMAKYCGGAMAITVLFRTTISDLLCPDCSAWAHIVLVTVSCCPILRSEIRHKTHLPHLQTGQLAAFRKSDIEPFFASKTMYTRFRQHHKMRLLARLSLMAPVSVGQPSGAKRIILPALLAATAAMAQGDST